MAVSVRTAQVANLGAACTHGSPDARLSRCQPHPAGATVQTRRVRGYAATAPADLKEKRSVRPGKAARSGGWKSRLGNRAPRAQYRVLRCVW
jgi:hypothetical protein